MPLMNKFNPISFKALHQHQKAAPKKSILDRGSLDPEIIGF